MSTGTNQTAENVIARRAKAARAAEAAAEAEGS
jgi:hypothetical protein